MAEHIDWLRKQAENAERELSGIVTKMTALEAEYSQIQERLSVWTQALNMAQKQRGNAPDPVQLELPPHRRKATIADLAEEILREGGPLDSGELADFLTLRGKRVSRNTVTVTLNRFRPQRFNRNKKGKWYVKAGEKKK